MFCILHSSLAEWTQWAHDLNKPTRVQNERRSLHVALFALRLATDLHIDLRRTKGCSITVHCHLSMVSCETCPRIAVQSAICRAAELALCNFAHVLRVTGRSQWGHRTVAVFCVAFDCLKLVLSCLLSLLMKWAEMPRNWGGWLSVCCRLIRLKVMPRNWLRLAFEWLPTVPRRPLYQHEPAHLGLSNKLCTSCPCHSCKQLNYKLCFWFCISPVVKTLLHLHYQDQSVASNEWKTALCHTFVLKVLQTFIVWSFGPKFLMHPSSLPFYYFFMALVWHFISTGFCWHVSAVRRCRAFGCDLNFLLWCINLVPCYALASLFSFKCCTASDKCWQSLEYLLGLHKGTWILGYLWFDCELISYETVHSWAN